MRTRSHRASRVSFLAMNGSISAVLAIALPSTAVVGFVYLALAFAATFLMYHLWGYPYDEATRTSSAPRWAMWLHRGLGYAFVASFVFMMWRMVPRLSEYQVEFPARSVVHIVLAFTIGSLLLIKIAIIRFFRHFEEWMPVLGTAVLVCSIVMLGLSLPAVLREHSLAHRAPGGDPYSEASRARVARLLPDAELPAEADLKQLATGESLKAGRGVLLDQCSGCHDLRTVLEKPRPPKAWAQVVARMGEKPSLFAPLTELDQWRVTAYLIAITPDLQRSAKLRRQESAGGDEDAPSTAPAADAGVDIIAPSDAGMTVVGDAGVHAPPDAGVTAIVVNPPPPVPAIDPARAKATFERKCSGCHELADIDAKPPTTRAQVNVLVARMIENGLEASRHDLELIRWWLAAHYVEHAK